MEAILIDNIEVWPRDLGKMTFDEANKACASLGPGWRLPTIEEFNTILWPVREELPDIGRYVHYWSSIQATSFHGVWLFTFAFKHTNTTNVYDKNHVRPVRDLTIESASEYLLKEF
ncbi:Protein of unknown function DUF1566 [uncultured Caudovirales phage]|uniref:DUF1566 domain-containing protein n=1 Tax=uncultured Caudovirales phage TaxID=2100421 RepID=A0A6J5PVG6_9CAUD|nr:Protein of unknown function DUF1566 [uncultured Caudovirales phage]CAB4193503.1 Protein of unknown function DUF1566 [uncultured Caudovirales phage]